MEHAQKVQEEVEQQLKGLKEKQAKAREKTKQEDESQSMSRYGKRMGKQFAAYAEKINQASGMNFSETDGNLSSTNMTPKDIDTSMLGFVQEIEPEVPRKVKKNMKVTAHPVTGEPVIERI